MLLQAVRPLAVPVLQNSRSAATRVASLQQLVARWLHRCQRRPPTTFISTPESPDSFPSSSSPLAPRLLLPHHPTSPALANGSFAVAVRLALARSALDGSGALRLTAEWLH